MNPTLTAEKLLQDDAPGGVLAFLASRSKQSSRRLSAPASDVFKGIREAVDQLILRAVETRSEKEFRGAFMDAFPKYVGFTLALSSFSTASVPDETINRMARESICEMEADFRDKAVGAFGSEIRDQLMFTAWTLRKITDLLIQIGATQPDVSRREEDKDCLSHFLGTALQAKFSLDCFNMAMHLDRPIYPEVIESLKDGLRAMVNAYAWARKGLALRVPEDDSTMPSVVSDEEDDELARSSMQDMTFLLDAEESQ